MYEYVACTRVPMTFIMFDSFEFFFVVLRFPGEAKNVSFSQRCAGFFFCVLK